MSEQITEKEINNIIQEYQSDYQKVLQKFSLSDSILEPLLQVGTGTLAVVGLGAGLGYCGFLAEGAITGAAGGPVGAIIGGIIGVVVGGIITYCACNKITESYDDERKKKYDEINKWAMDKLKINQTSTTKVIKDRQKGFLTMQHPDKYKNSTEDEQNFNREEFFQTQVAFEFIKQAKILEKSWEE